MLNRLSTKEPKEGYMDSYKIITNTTADLPAEYIRKMISGLFTSIILWTVSLTERIKSWTGRNFIV